TNFEKRHAWREQFESMRLLYVAASRAEDRLIMSGVTEEIAALNRGNDCWLKWVWQALEMEGRSSSGVVQLTSDVDLQLTVNLADEPVEEIESQADVEPQTNLASADSLQAAFPLIETIGRQTGNAIHRFSVTQLINYRRCPRQYYFDRVLKVPTAEELSVWNNAEAPEGPANLTATLKGAVIHRFCERYTVDQNIEECLRRSFDDVVRARPSQLADRLVEIDIDVAIKDLLPLAKNYLASDVFKRVEAVPKIVADDSPPPPGGQPGLWSEIGFRLRRPLGILFGIIDKLLITRAEDGALQIEIIDFKTHHIKAEKFAATVEGPAPRVAAKTTQFAFNFEDPAKTGAVKTAAEDYELQMQGYALAVRELLPSLADSTLRVTLHFLHPNVEVHLVDELLEPARCQQAVDEAMQRTIYSSDPADFPVRTAPHCRMCNFLRVCTAGKQYVAASSAA
ncbi:MAG TPA: PD-(D/E)XK nuclease family protein, partial [Pyrinomonadaceae bacterium]|nr:PD-(D/E)XK nuclease family protein [Pyrinomonadaceae bacterium]